MAEDVVYHAGYSILIRDYVEPSEMEELRAPVVVRVIPLDSVEEVEHSADGLGIIGALCVPLFVDRF